MSQTNCPICNYPEGKTGYHFRGVYAQGAKCNGCGYHEVVPVIVSDVYISQKCTIYLDVDLEVIVFLDWTVPTNPKLKSCNKRNPDGSLTKLEPTELQEKVIMHYVKDSWAKWLKLT